MTPAAVLDIPAAPFPVLSLGVPEAGLPHLDITPLKARKRRAFRKPDMTGDVVVKDHDPAGRVVSVGLFGKHGEGHSALFDREDWEAVSERFTRRLVVVNPSGSPLHYVCSGVWAVAPIARQRAACPCLNIARFVARAQKGEVVRYRNGDWRDLRRSNLRVEPKARRRAEPVGVAHAV